MPHKPCLSRVRRASVAVATLVCGLSASAFAGVCNPLSSATCGVPFPSNFWSVSSASSPTGVRLQLEDGIVRPEVLAQLPAADGFTPSLIFNGASGYSAATVAVFEFDKRPAEFTLPADGGSAVRAFDLDTGKFLPIRTSLSTYARSDKVSAPSEVLQVFPLSRWPYGHRVLIAVTGSLMVPFSFEPWFEAKVAKQPVGSPEAAYAGQVRQALQAAGINSSYVRTATLFTVRDRNEAVAPMKNLLTATIARDHGVRNLKTSYELFNPDIAATVTGEIRLDNYRRKGGIGTVDFSGATRMDEWVPFRLTIPRSAANKPAPVVIYAHGLGGSKDMMEGIVTDENASLGAATITIDFPNHGARTESNGGGVFDNLSIDRLDRQIGMMTQCTLDFGSLYKAVKSSLRNVDVVAKLSLFNLNWMKADGLADLNVDRMSMQGTSLGGVLGSHFASLAPQLDGGRFSVTGVGITSILSESILWDTSFSKLEPPAANGAEALMLRAAIQQSLDYGDPINTLDYMHYPPLGQNKRALLITTGAGDTIVPNASSIAAAAIANLPLVGEQLYAMPGVRVQADYDADGYGIRQYRPWTSPLDFGPWITGATSHLIFERPDEKAELKVFLQRFIIK
jgi:pimeloyl-ACP methyl ester carboxylesterase